MENQLKYTTHEDYMKATGAPYDKIEHDIARAARRLNEALSARREFLRAGRLKYAVLAGLEEGVSFAEQALMMCKKEMEGK